MSVTGTFDVQVNGYGGVDFNQDDLTAGAMQVACDAMRADGVTGFLPTIITEQPDQMVARVRRIAELCDEHDDFDGLVAGIHVEGPFLSPDDGYRGAHPADAIQAADPGLAARLLDAANGRLSLFTLAPEQDENSSVTKYLASRGVVVSAGHTNASLDQLKAATDAGLSMFTHLGNGCPGTMDRHDNIVQRALSLRDRLWLCFIADAVHIPIFALRNYLDLAEDRAIITTDAMAAAGLGPGRYQISRWDLVVGEDLAARSHDGSHLVGSAMSMPQAAANLQIGVGLTPDQIQNLTVHNPRRALGLSE